MTLRGIMVITRVVTQFLVFFIIEGSWNSLLYRQNIGGLLSANKHFTRLCYSNSYHYLQLQLPECVMCEFRS